MKKLFYLCFIILTAIFLFNFNILNVYALPTTDCSDGTCQAALCDFSTQTSGAPIRCKSGTTISNGFCCKPRVAGEVKVELGDLEGQTKEAGYDLGTSDTAAKNIALIIGNFIQYVLTFVGALTLAMIVYSGMIFLTSRGNDQAISKAKNILTWAILGTIFTIGAYTFLTFVLMAFRGEGGGSFGTPQALPVEQAPAGNADLKCADAPTAMNTELNETPPRTFDSWKCCPSLSCASNSFSASGGNNGIMVWTDCGNADVLCCISESIENGVAECAD